MWEIVVIAVLLSATPTLQQYKFEDNQIQSHSSLQNNNDIKQYIEVNNEPNSLNYNTAGNSTNKNLVSSNETASQRLLSWSPQHHHPPDCPHHPPYPPAPRCGGVFQGPRAVIVSPGFPGPYPARIACTYSVLPTTPGPACYSVKLQRLAVRWSPNCNIDWIQIDNGPRLCGSLSGERVYKTDGRLRIEFLSGSTPAPPGSGFHLFVSQIPCPSSNCPHHPYPPPGIKPPPHYPPPPIRPPPPAVRPPPPHPPTQPEIWWKWIWVLKCQWGGTEYLPPGRCPPAPNLPSPPPPPNSSPCDRVVRGPQFVISSDEWLPRQSPNGPWSCRLTILKAHPEACEVYLNLAGVSLNCGREFLQVGRERVCGSQPLRQMSVDFSPGGVITIEYHNLQGGRAGNFHLRGQQSADCEPFVLDVTPVRKVATPPTISNKQD